jgi:hypothetical protein
MVSGSPEAQKPVERFPISVPVLERHYFDTYEKLVHHCHFSKKAFPHQYQRRYASLFSQCSGIL